MTFYPCQSPGSEKETTDILAAYTKFSGSLESILANVMCSTVEDEDRFISIVNDAIAAGSKDLKDSNAREKRRQKADSEALEAEAYAKELGVHDKLFGKGAKASGKGKGKGRDAGGDEDALKALIQSKQAGRLESMLEGLEAKYAPKSKPKKGKGKKRAQDDDKDDVEEPLKGKRARKIDVEPTEDEFERIQKEMDARRAKSATGSSEVASKETGRK